MSTSPTIRCQVNGEHRDLPVGINVAQLLELLGVQVHHVAVEVNEQVVRRERHAQTVLSAGARVEVVTFVGGG